MDQYVRFRTNLRDANSSTPLGIFSAAGKLLESETLDSWSAEWAEEICNWFNNHLIAPRLRPGHQRAIFWFRAERTDLVQRLWSLTHVLREGGLEVQLVHTTHPGRVCYEDDFQVAAIPWKW